MATKNLCYSSSLQDISDVNYGLASYPTNLNLNQNNVFTDFAITKQRNTKCQGKIKSCSLLQIY